MPDASLQHRFALFILVSFQLLLIFWHEQWLDEYQAWEIARGSSSLSDVFRNARFEGHPPVWHVLLWLIQKFWPDVNAMRVLQAVIAIGSLSIIVLRAPFPTWLRITVALNYFVLFEYNVLARPYGLAMLLMLMALAAWGRPLAWFALFLMPLMGIHSALLASALAADRLFVSGNEPLKTKVIAATAFSAVNLLAIYLSLPDPQTVQALAHPPEITVLARTIMYFWFAGAMLAPFSKFGGWAFELGGEFLNSFAIISGMAAGLLLPIILWQLCERNSWRRFLVMGLFVVLGLIWVFVYPTRIRHYGILMLLFVALAWIDGCRGRVASEAFKALSIYLAAIGTLVGALSLTQPFSYDHMVADTMRKLVPADAAIATEPPMSSVSALTGQPAFNLRKRCRETFVRWNFSRLADLPPNYADEHLLATTRQAGGRLYLVAWEAPAPANQVNSGPLEFGGIRFTSATFIPDPTFKGLDVKILGLWPKDRWGVARYLLQLDLPGSEATNRSFANRLPMCPR